MRPAASPDLSAEVVPNRDYLQEILGAMVTEQMILDDGTTADSTPPTAAAAGGPR